MGELPPNAVDMTIFSRMSNGVFGPVAISMSKD